MIENGTFAWTKPKTDEEGALASTAAPAAAAAGAGAASAGEVAVQVTGGTDAKGATDGSDEPGGFPVRNVNFKAPAGSLTAVVGSVGSGKSSLLSCLMGEMHAISGHAHINARRVGFVAQTVRLPSPAVLDHHACVAGNA